MTDKNLSLWSPVAIERFLEERFPHPSFLPVDPISRAAIRQLVIEICEHYSTFDRVEYTLPLLRNLVTALGDSYYLCGDTYTEADIALAPWLYKVMDYLRVPPSVQRYAERLFKRSAFRASLVEVGTGLAKDCA